MEHLICGNCLSKLRKIQNESVDLILTSPPYNLGSTHHTGSKKFKPYQDNMSEKDYQNWQIDVLSECYRVLKHNGSILYNHKNRIRDGAQISPYSWINKTPFIQKQEFVWINRSQNFDKIRFYPFTERIYWLTKSSKTVLFNAINSSDVFKWKGEGTKNKSHKRAFPLEMACDLLCCFPSSKVILDPFMGSGTVGVASKILGKDFIGIEKSKTYFQKAKERIETFRQNELSNILYRNGIYNIMEDKMDLQNDKSHGTESLLNGFLEKLETMIQPKETFNLFEAAEYCKTTPDSIKYYVNKAKTLSHRKIGKDWVFTKRDLEDFLERQLRPAC